MSSRTIFISGAHTGIGLEIVKALLDSPNTYTIIMAGRSLDKTNAAIKDLQTSFPSSKTKLAALTLDVESDSDIAAVADAIKNDFNGTIDVLINNAGASFEQAVASGKSDMTEREAFNKAWDVNVTGAHLLTRALCPFLLKSSRPYLIFMTSGTASLVESMSEELRFNQAADKGLPKPIGITAYRSCKTGLNMVMREWSKYLRKDGVFVWSISPGFLATGLGGVGEETLKKLGAGDPSIGGRFIRDVVEGKREDDNGKVLKNGGVQPW